MRDWLIGLLLLLIVAGCTVGYIRYDAVQEERAKVELDAAKQYKELNEKYEQISAQYNALRDKREAKRQVVLVREDKVVNENRDFYDGDCFDDAGLQHIQDAQSGSTKE